MEPSKLRYIIGLPEIRWLLQMCRDWRALKARQLKGQSDRAVTKGVRDLGSAVSATPENLKQ